MEGIHAGLLIKRYSMISLPDEICFYLRFETEIVALKNEKAELFGSASNV